MKLLICLISSPMARVDADLGMQDTRLLSQLFSGSFTALIRTKKAIDKLARLKDYIDKG